MSIPDLQAALAGEHATVYAYGVAAARLPGPARAQALLFLDAHRTARDALVTRVLAAGEQPVPPRAAYALPFAVLDPSSARRLLALVEERLADLYGDLVSTDAAADRRRDATALGDCAARATAWSGRTEAFPGYVAPPA